MALSGTVLKQKGQSRVVGVAAGLGLKRSINAFTGRTMKKYITNASIKKLSIVLIK